MRKLLGLVVLLAGASPAIAEEASNPAFLGVGMHDGGPQGSGPCTIDTVTADSGAAVAGVHPSDVIVSLDATPISNCDALVTAIQNRVAGQTVNIEVRRGVTQLTLSATLPSRADVLRKRFVGRPLPLKTLIRVEDQEVADLSSRGKTTVLGWFDQSRCTTCAAAFTAIQEWAKQKGNRIDVMGVTAATMDSVTETAIKLKPAQRKLDVPLLVADAETFGDMSITDIKRIHFLVIDCRGVVSYATPLKPDADDKTAVLEELFAATEQAARRTK